MKSLRLFPVLLGVLILSACTSNTGVRINNSWINGDYQGGPLENILIVGLGTNPANVKLWEDTFAQALSRRGRPATAAHTIFAELPRTGDEAADLEASKRKIRELGFDGVILGKIRDVESGPVRQGGGVETVATPAFYSWTAFYQPQVFSVQNQARLVHMDRVRVETNIYSVQSETMVYTAMIDSLNATNTDTAINGLVNAVIDDLRRRGVL